MRDLDYDYTLKKHDINDLAICATQTLQTWNSDNVLTLKILMTANSGVSNIKPLKFTVGKDLNLIFKLEHGNALCASIAVFELEFQIKNLKSMRDYGVNLKEFQGKSPAI